MTSRAAKKVDGLLLLVVLLTFKTVSCFSAHAAKHKPKDSPFRSIHDPKASFTDSGRISLFATSGQLQAESTHQLPPPPPLVVLLPAFNEVKRIGETLDSYQSFLSSSHQWKNKSQILVVDDGSNDGTPDFVRDWKRDGMVGVDCVSLPQNEGKGAAVSFGIHHLVETYVDDPCLVLIADADGSGDISCLENMANVLGTLIASQSQSLPEEELWNTPALVNGFRGYEGSSLPRSILRWGFRMTVRGLCGDLRVRDSQCGFKLLTLAAARQLYADLNLKQWSHDVEVLYRAREWNMCIAEQAVPWQDKGGSKLVASSSSAVQASTIMFLEVLRMRIEYALGRWRMPSL